MKPKIGELWRVMGLFEWEPEAVVRIISISESGMLDVNYELDEEKIGDCRILPPTFLIRKVVFQ